MVGNEISVGDAVKGLRDQIEGSLLRKIWSGLGIVYRVFVLLAKVGILVVATGFVGWLMGLDAAAVVFYCGLAWLLIPRAWKAAKYLLGMRRERKGIAIGTSYRRVTEQYANVDAGPKRGTNVSFLSGTTGPYYVDYGSEPNPHVLVVGSSSSGKTSTAKSFICRNYLGYGTRFLMIDWTGDNEKWAGECGASLWKVPLNFKINMFRLNGMDPEQRASMVEDALLIAGRMTMLQATKIKNMALRSYMSGSEPTLDSITESLSREGRKNSLISYRLSAIWRVVGEEPDSFWSSIFTNNTVISLAGLNESEKAVVAYFLLQRICELFEREEPGKRERLLVVVDEAWQLLNSSSRLGVHESLAERVVRVGRRYGFGIVTSTQQLDDVPEPFINSSSLIFLHNYRQLHQNRMALNQFDLAYLSGADQGECLIFDRLRAQSGQVHPDYVKVRKMDAGEYAEMRSRSAAFEVPVSAAVQQESLPKLPGPVTEQTRTRGQTFRIPDGAPSPAEHAALLAIYHSPDKTLAGVVGYVKERGWIKSNTTLYGYTAKPGVLDGVVSAGFATKSRDAYELTDQGLGWVDPEKILINQSDKLGSEEHKRLLIKTINKLHETNMLVVTSSVKHSPDLVAWPMHQKKRYLWDREGVKGYECQTSARKDSVKENLGKSEIWGVPVVWVAESNDMLDGIKRICRGGEYMLVGN